MRKFWRNQRGFTLIELVVVVAILGILAAVLTPKVLEAMDNARDKSAIATGKVIQLAMERYMIEEDSYPTVDTLDADDDDAITVDELIAVLGAYANLNAADFSEGDTPGDTELIYEYPADIDGDDVDDDGEYLLTFTLPGPNREVTVTRLDVTAAKPTE